MSARRKYFNCSICGKETSQTSPNYYKQKKSLGFNRCADCSKKINAEKQSLRMKNRYLDACKNIDIVNHKCRNCGKVRKIQYRMAKQNLLCRSCAAINARTNNSEMYRKLAINRIGNKEFSKSVSRGINKIPRQIRACKARKAAIKLWNNKEYVDKSLETRRSIKHRQKMRNIWTSERRKLASIKAKEHFKNLWKSGDFRNKMAKIRSDQSGSISNIQKFLYSILDSLAVEYEKEYVIGPWTFDCFIKEHNILIECQGEYWHSLPKAIKNDQAKLTYINKYFPEYRVIYLYEHEFYTKDQIINRLKYDLGLSNIEQVSFKFKNVVVKKLKASDINDFMHKYHYLGPKNHSINYGFFYNGVLIACCSYSPVSRIETATRLGVNNNEIKELSRFCIHPKYQKKNFGSWAISRTIKLITAANDRLKYLVAFADTTLNHHGIIYKASNWKYDGETRKSYYYVKDGWVMHKKTLYNRAIKMSMKEKDYAAKHGYKRMNAKPQIRYIYKLK